MRSPPSPSSNSLRGRTRAAILEAARELFLHFGPRKTTLGEVARKARVSRTTLYSYFDNKEDLYRTLLEADADAFIREAEAILASDVSKMPRLVELTRHIYQRSHVMHLSVVASQDQSLADVANAFNRAQEARIVEILRTVITDGIDRGKLRAVDPERVAYLMFHLGRFLVEQEVSGLADYDFDEMLSVMDDVFARGMAVRDRHAEPGE